ncbi:hypothetical protein FRX31_023331, partial [Thalictrum thalictroides]
MSSTGDDNIPTISFNYHISEPTWKQENNRVQNIFSESQATITIEVSHIRQLVTSDDHPLLLREFPDHESATTTSKLGFSNLLFEADMVDYLGLKPMLKNYDQIPAQLLWELNRILKSTCSRSLADIISKEMLEEISITIKIEFVRTEYCDMQDFIDQQAVHPKLAPAAPSAVEALKTKQYCDEENSKDPCTICREEFMT